MNVIEHVELIDKSDFFFTNEEHICACISSDLFIR